MNPKILIIVFAAIVSRISYVSANNFIKIVTFEDVKNQFAKKSERVVLCYDRIENEYGLLIRVYNNDLEKAPKKADSTFEFRAEFKNNAKFAAQELSNIGKKLKEYHSKLKTYLETYHTDPKTLNEFISSTQKAIGQHYTGFERHMSALNKKKWQDGVNDIMKYLRDFNSSLEKEISKLFSKFNLCLNENS